MNTGVAITMFVNLLLAIGMYLLCKDMNDKFARIMIFFFVMTPTFGALISILLDKGGR